MMVMFGGPQAQRKGFSGGAAALSRRAVRVDGNEDGRYRSASVGRASSKNHAEDHRC
jgi:hypothetical protein